VPVLVLLLAHLLDDLLEDPHRRDALARPRRPHEERVHQVLGADAEDVSGDPLAVDVHHETQGDLPLRPAPRKGPAGQAGERSRDRPPRHPQGDGNHRRSSVARHPLDEPAGIEARAAPPCARRTASARMPPQFFVPGPHRHGHHHVLLPPGGTAAVASFASTSSSGGQQGRAWVVKKPVFQALGLSGRIQPWLGGGKLRGQVLPAGHRGTGGEKSPSPGIYLTRRFGPKNCREEKNAVCLPPLKGGGC